MPPKKKKDGSKVPKAKPKENIAAAPGGDEPEFTAIDGCLNQDDATQLVFSCTGVGQVNVDTKLGVLFPSDVRRRGFCGCVFGKASAAGCDIEPGDIPCGKTKSIADVIDSIAC